VAVAAKAAAESKVHYYALPEPEELVVPASKAASSAQIQYPVVAVYGTLYLISMKSLGVFMILKAVQVAQSSP